MVICSCFYFLKGATNLICILCADLSPALSPSAGALIFLFKLCNELVFSYSLVSF
jgi:hypothetical protein